MRDGSQQPYSLKYLLSEDIIGSPLNHPMKITDFEFYNSGLVDVLLEYPGNYLYVIEAPEKLKHQIVQGKVNVGDKISFLYDKNLNRFEVVKVN